MVRCSCSGGHNQTLTYDNFSHTILGGSPSFGSASLGAKQPSGWVIGWGSNTGGEATGVPTKDFPSFSSGVVHIEGRLLTNIVAIAAGREFSRKGSTHSMDSAEELPLSHENLALPSKMIPALPPVRLKPTYAQRWAFL